MTAIEGLLYANTGDWVAAASALVAHVDGRLEIVYWDALDAAAHERVMPLHVASTGPTLRVVAPAATLTG